MNRVINVWVTLLTEQRTVFHEVIIVSYQPN